MKRFNRIMLVDDDDVSNYLTQGLIQKMEFSGELSVYKNGDEALNYIRDCMFHHDTAECPELVLLDINMPIMDGFEFLEEFEKLQKNHNKDIPVIILTTSGYKFDVQKAKSYKVAGYINKPLTIDKLQEVMRENF
ncbi:MAG: response regulator [Bacteroidota bacterium]|nr:response regulator [Bacteroidota bacterium]